MQIRLVFQSDAFLEDIEDSDIGVRLLRAAAGKKLFESEGASCIIRGV